MIPKNIDSKRNKYLHEKEGHPLCTIKNIIENNFTGFSSFSRLLDIVSIEDNFDKLLIPIDHQSRSRSDTFYISDKEVLRTHTSAHQNKLLSDGFKHFLVTGDVFRRDEIDCFHYPVFHQMEGVSIVENAENDLHAHLTSLVKSLFGDVEYRVTDSYFPFTNPSWEYEINWNGKWVEVLGCGLVQKKILENCGITNKEAWAFGLGLERLAMILYDIPDIRLFWSEDERFKQWKNNEIKKFSPYSSHPVCYKDISFWVNEQYSSNDFFEVVRDISGDLIESVVLIDKFKTETKESHCYRIKYCSMDRNLSNEEINLIQEKIREEVVNKLNVVLR